MEWIVYIIFLLMGYLLRMLGEEKKVTEEPKEKTFKMPTLNPIKLHQEKIEKKEEEQRNRETAIMLENIDNYNGTSNGQKEVV